jgi:hypothetical protein
MDFRKTGSPLFVDIHTTVNAQEKQLFDLILSPSFYWVKHITIPIKSTSELKKFLPSLFEDTVPKGKYSYYAYADGDAYLAFAYDDKQILNILSDKGIGSEQINRVYFAQSEFQDTQEAIAIDANFVLDVEDHVVVKLPKELVSNSVPLNLDEHVFSGHTITLARYTHIATTKSLIQFSLFMGALIAIYMLDLIVSQIKIKEFEAAPLTLYAEHKLPGTKIQNEAISETLLKQYQQQIQMRQITAKVLDLKLDKDEYITLYDLNEKRLTVELKLASEKKASAITKSLKLKDLSPKEKYKDGLLILEFTL